MSYSNSLKIKPKAFALDEKLQEGLVIFETIRSKTTFSVTVGPIDDVMSMAQEGGVSTNPKPHKQANLAQKILEEFHYKPKTARIDSEGRVFLKLTDVKKKSSHSDIQLDLNVSEMLSLWSHYHFPIYSSKKFIHSSRERILDQETLDASLPNAELYKEYGQKYLM